MRTPLAGFRPACRPVPRLLAFSTRWPWLLVLAWRGAWLAGGFRHWVVSGWRRPILWIGVAFAAGWAIDRWIVSISWLSFWTAVVLAILAAFALAVWRAMGRVVIEPFLDYTSDGVDAGNKGDAASGSTAPGLNDALVSELAQLRELFQAVEERAGLRTATGSGRPLEATLQLEDVSSFLQDAATGDAKVSLGPLVLPIGLVMAMLGRLAQGPRVTGALQLITSQDVEGKPTRQVVLTGYYASRQRLASWSVIEPLPEGAASIVQTAAVRGMVEELAARMFADLALGGSTSWQASRRFLSGLRFYRLAHESRQDRVLRLRRAARFFVEALADDEELPLARYNLGVVYGELRDAYQEWPADAENFASAAETSFGREIQRGGSGWEPYYALALMLEQRGRYAAIPPLCDRVIARADNSARKAIAYDAKGFAERKLEEIGTDLALTRAIASRRRAVAYSTLALLRAELRSDDPDASRSLAAHCLLNLGIAVAYSGRSASWNAEGARASKRAFRQCRSLLRHAARLDDSFLARFELGKIAYEFGEPARAVDELRAALRIDPTSCPCWAWLAKADARLSADTAEENAQRAFEWEQLARHAVRMAKDRLDLNAGPELTQEIVDALAEALETIGDSDEAERVRNMVDAAAVSGSIDELETQLADVSDRWAYAQIALQLGHQQRATENHELGAAYFQLAIRALGDDYREEIRRSGMHGMVALALMALEERQQDALQWAHAAVAVDPMSSWEREVLGNVYDTIGDLENSVEAYEDALAWSPNSAKRDAKLHSNLGSCHWRLAEAASGAARMSGYRRTIEHYEAALALQSPTDLPQRVNAHYWLGRAYTAADQYGRAVPHFRNALAARDGTPIVQTYLGEAYMRMKGYEEAEDVLSKAIATSERAAEEDPRPTVGSVISDEWPVGELAASAHRTLALSFIERDVRLDEAREHVRHSERLLDKLEGDADPAARASGRELEGRILLREDHLREAVAALEESVGLAPDSEAYVHLAEAYKEQAVRARNKQHCRTKIERARRACLHARDLDRSQMYEDEIDGVLAELDHLAAPTPA